MICNIFETTSTNYLTRRVKAKKFMFGLQTNFIDLVSQTELLYLFIDLNWLKIFIRNHCLPNLRIFGIWLAYLDTLRKKFVQQNFFCCPDKTFCCPSKAFFSSNQNLIDIAKCFVGTKKEFCCINTNKIVLLIWQNCFFSAWIIIN